MVRSWWQRGCPHSMTPAAWLFAMPVWVLLAAGNVWLTEAAGLWLSVLFAAVAHLASAVFIGLVVAAVDRLGRSRRSWARLVVFIIIGWIEVLGAAGLVWLSGAGSWTVRGVDLIAASILAVVWGAVVGLVVDTHRHDAAARAGLLRNLARERALALQAAKAVADYRSMVLRSTGEVVELQLRKARNHSVSPESAAAQLHLLAEEVIRPLSHELRRGEADEQSLVEAVQSVNAPSLPPLREYLASAFSPSRTFNLSIAALVASLLPTALVNDMFGSMRGGAAFMSLVSVGVVFAAGLGGLVNLTRRDELQLQRAIESSEWAAARLRQLAWSERERIGRALHGDVQSRIVATALQMQLGDSDQVAGGLSALEQRLHEHFADQSDDEQWQRSLQRIEDVWRHSIRLCIDIASPVRGRLEADPVAGHALVEVIREATTNAVRHAHADVVEVFVQLVGDLIEVRVQDNGPGTKSDVVAGLGSRMMDEACLAWRLETVADGHVLRAQIPTGTIHE